MLVIGVVIHVFIILVIGAGHWCWLVTGDGWSVVLAGHWCWLVTGAGHWCWLVTGAGWSLVLAGHWCWLVTCVGHWCGHCGELVVLVDDRRKLTVLRVPVEPP